jgi:hypothetical protein
MLITCPPLHPALLTALMPLQLVLTLMILTKEIFLPIIQEEACQIYLLNRELRLTGNRRVTTHLNTMPPSVNFRTVQHGFFVICYNLIPIIVTAKRHTLHNGVEARPSISQHSSMSQADDNFSPYEKVKYDKIKSKEHPYAQLQPTTSRQAVLEETNLVCEERTSLLRPDGSSTSSEPSAPPRSRRSSVHSGLAVDIPAASAVAGGIAASPELPYMTPPVTQPNFSGDSQDSSSTCGFK